MGLVKGQDVLFYLVDDPNSIPVACARSITFEIQREMIESATTFQGKYRTYAPAAMTWTATLEGLVYLSADITVQYGINNMYDLVHNNTLLSLKFYETDGTNTLLKEGYGYIKTITETASFDNMVTFTAEFTGSGAITITS